MEFEKHLDKISIYQVTDFTNFLNVLRLNKLDNNVSLRAKSSLIKRIQTLFSTQEHAADL